MQKLLKGNLLLIVILLAAAFLRLWRIDEYLPFLGDEGRDVRIVSRFLQDFDLMFIGPRTSIGDMYLGPLYYYLIAPFLWAWNFSPTGPAVFVALLGTATVGLIWHAAREWFGKTAAISAALLYAVSPLIINFSKHSWNPNIMPFFALLCIYSIWRVWQSHDFKWLLVLGVSFAFVVQSHYLGFLLVPTLALVWLVTFMAIRKTANAKRFLVHSAFGFLAFALLMSPLFLFDLKHNWQNFESLKKFFLERQETVSAKPWNAIPLLWPFWSENIVSRFLVLQKTDLGHITALTLLGLFVWAGSVWKKTKETQKLHAHILLGIWILFGLLGIGLLKQNIYDHYFGFLFPAPFLAVGATAQFLWDKKLKWLVLLTIGSLTLFNLSQNPFIYPPQRQMNRVEEVDRKIIELSQGQPFNFGLIAKRNYEEGYLYFFEQSGASIREIDPQRMEETLTEALFVVCEEQVCEPINNPKAEIANFGWAKIEQEWEVRGFKLFKLVHREQNEKL